MSDNRQRQTDTFQPDKVTPSHDAAAGYDVAYLVNQYPKISHSFIRREIEAVEANGITVHRFALRGWDEPLVDARDVDERSRTTYLLEKGVLPLVRAAVAIAFRHPRAFLRAAVQAVRMSARSTTALPYHVIYLCHACRMMQLLSHKPVAHLHAHFGTNSAEVALLLRFLGGPPYSFTVHGADEADDGKYLHLDSKVQHAKFVAAVSGYTRAQLMRHVSPDDWKKLHVVHCGLEAVAFQANEPIDEPVLLCVGRLSPEKGHLILIDAFNALAGRHPAARLVFAGDGPLRSMLEQRISHLGLEKQVRITGWISNERVRDEIRASRVLVQPSLQEGLPVVLMEAMAMSRPVISTYVAGIPELVIPGEVGWLVPAGDVEALTGAMEQCLLTPAEDMRRMGVTAQTRARARHSISHEAAKLAALFGNFVPS